MTTSNPKSAQNNKSISCIVIGDGYIGKSSLVKSFLEKAYKPACVPTVFDNFNTKVQFNDESYEFKIKDTSGQSEYNRLRSLAYSDASCILLCFSLADRNSFENIKQAWIQELHTYCPNKPYILVGLKKDLRHHQKTCTVLNSCTQTPISYKEGADLAKRLRKFNCRKYTECSALTCQGTSNVFDEVILTVNEEKMRQMKRRQVCRIL